MQNLGLADRKAAGDVRVLVKLQRPPPEMRIFSPAALAWSMTSTRRPRLPASMAHIMPAAPAPITTTSKLSMGALTFVIPAAAKRRVGTQGPTQSPGSGLSGSLRGPAAGMTDFSHAHNR